MRHISPSARLARLALCLLALCTGCFYDSTWGARKTAQRHNAALATPASLAPAPSDTAVPPNSDGAAALHMRLHATPAYEAQTPGWRSHVVAIAEQASATLAGAIGARLVIDSSDDWNHATAPRLDGDLAALRDEDTGDGVDLVVGLVGGLPMATEDFDQLGMSEVRGKHLVVRAPNVAAEYEAVERAFDELKPEDRARLLRERVRHREVAVLLHEIGHALGAEHETTAGSLMRRAYDPKMSAFDAESIVRMQRGLAHTPDPVAQPQGHSPADAGAAEPSIKNEAPTELSDADREVWRRAWELSKGGDAQGAWQAARPLFTRYPRVYGVQDLRCKLAMAHFASYGDARVECDALMNVTMTGGKSK